MVSPPDGVRVTPAGTPVFVASGNPEIAMFDPSLMIYDLRADYWILAIRYLAVQNQHGSPSIYPLILSRPSMPWLRIGRRRASFLRRFVDSGEEVLDRVAKFITICYIENRKQTKINFIAQ